MCLVVWSKMAQRAIFDQMTKHIVLGHLVKNNVLGHLVNAHFCHIHANFAHPCTSETNALDTCRNIRKLVVSVRDEPPQPMPTYPL